MNSNFKELLNLPKSPDYYKNYIIYYPNLPVDFTRIDLSFLCGDERKTLKTITSGDSTLLLKYKEEEGAVLSMETNNDDLTLLQLQGARSRKSYKVTTAIKWVDLFADQLNNIINHPHNYFKRITMPPLWEIKGLYDSCSENIISRYEQLANNLQMRFSPESQQYIKELR